MRPYQKYKKEAGCSSRDPWLPDTGVEIEASTLVEGTDVDVGRVSEKQCSHAALDHFVNSRNRHGTHLVPYQSQCERLRPHNKGRFMQKSAAFKNKTMEITNASGTALEARMTTREGWATERFWIRRQL